MPHWFTGDTPDAAVAGHLDEARRLGRTAAAVLLFAALPVGAWLALAPLASAVVAQAFVKVDLDRRPVQHAEGGIVREVRVRDGQRVEKGEALLLLGDVAVDAELNRLRFRQMTELASLARLEAEQLRATRIDFPQELLQAAAADPRLESQLAKERALFVARREALTGQIALLRTQREKVVQESSALQAQVAQAAESQKLQSADLENQRKLLKDGFISVSKISQLEAALADYGVKLEERRSEAARAEQRLVEIDLRMEMLESEYRQQASDQIKVVAARLVELQQELRKSADAAARQLITAPAAGEVVNLRFTSPGSVISPRETIAEIVPVDPRLVIEAHIRTEDVARVRQGQDAEIRFTAYRYRTTELIPGRVFYVAADRLVDKAANHAFYVALIEADPASLQASGEINPQAGMPAEVYIKGEDRTPLQYLLEPLTQVLRRAAREQ
jgi:HlyD family type I secretion membrane fusion protein